MHLLRSSCLKTCRVHLSDQEAAYEFCDKEIHLKSIQALVQPLRIKTGSPDYMSSVLIVMALYTKKNIKILFFYCSWLRQGCLRVILL